MSDQTGESLEITQGEKNLLVPSKVNHQRIKPNFRIRDHDCVTLNACSHSPAVHKLFARGNKRDN